MDPISDMLNRIRNAQAVKKQTVSFSFSKIKYEIAKILEKKNFIEKVGKKGRKEKKIIEITLKYEQEFPAISGLKRVSKPGQRIYLPASRLRPVRRGMGMAVVSTSQGLMTDKEARRQKLGGEIICEVW